MVEPQAPQPRFRRWKELLDWGTHLPQPVEAIASFLQQFGWKGIVGAVVGLGAAAGLTLMGWWIPTEKRALSPIWSMDSRNVYFVYSAKSAVEAHRANRVFIPEEGKEQAIRLSDVVDATILVSSAVSSEVLARLQPRSGVLSPEEFAQGDVIVLGGPIANVAYSLAVEKLSESGEPPFYGFDDTTMKCANGHVTSCDAKRAILDSRRSGKTFATEYEDQPSGMKRVIVDYGFFIIGPNPFASESKVIIIAGSHKVGTWGVTRFLTDRANAARVKNLYGEARSKRKYFAGVVRTDSRTGSATLEDSGEF